MELGESDREVRITAGLSGLDEKDVEIRLEESVLTLLGENKTGSAHSGANLHLNEIKSAN